MLYYVLDTGKEPVGFELSFAALETDILQLDHRGSKKVD